jgi:hypothetical protein
MCCPPWCTTLTAFDRNQLGRLSCGLLNFQQGAARMSNHSWNAAAHQASDQAIYWWTMAAVVGVALLAVGL